MLKVAVFLLVSAVGAYAASGAPGSREVQKVRIPQTASEHRAMAESYRAKAIAYQTETETHRLMCEEYKFKVAMPATPMETGPSLMQAQKQCERYARDTTDLVENARELAVYHEARAKALEAH